MGGRRIVAHGRSKEQYLQHGLRYYHGGGANLISLFLILAKYAQSYLGFASDVRYSALVFFGGNEVNCLGMKITTN